MNEKKNMEKQTGYKKKDHQGKEIYESIPLSFDFGKFEKQLVEIEWELRDCLNKNV